MADKTDQTNQTKTRPEIAENGDTPDGVKFLAELHKIMPDALSGTEVINAMGTILLAYTDGPKMAGIAFHDLGRSLASYFAEVAAHEAAEEEARRNPH